MGCRPLLHSWFALMVMAAVEEETGVFAPLGCCRIDIVEYLMSKLDGKIYLELSFERTFPFFFGNECR